MIRRRVASGIAAVAVASASLVLSGNIATAGWSNSSNLSFSGCSWTAIGGSFGQGATPYTKTLDRNGGCRYLDADLKFVDVGDTVTRTKWCSSVNAEQRVCDEFSAIHVDSRSRAQSWETYLWQSTGWWL